MDLKVKDLKVKALKVKALKVNNIIFNHDKNKYYTAWNYVEELIQNKYPGGYFFKGKLCLYAKLYKEANENFNKALISKNPIWIWRDLGKIFLKGKVVKKDITKANKCLDEIGKLMRKINPILEEKLSKAQNSYIDLNMEIQQFSTSNSNLMNVFPSTSSNNNKTKRFNKPNDGMNMMINDYPVISNENLTGMNQMVENPFLVKEKLGSVNMYPMY